MKMNIHPGKISRVAMLLAIIALLFTGCSKTLATNTDSLYVPTAADATSTATLTDLQAGRTLFVNSCGRCHSLYSPDSYSAASWKSIVPGMASRAGLSSTQASQVIKYVTRGQ
jgi:PBP1b-binding outer membrane lipoprotein LpoB